MSRAAIAALTLLAATPDAGQTAPTVPTLIGPALNVGDIARSLHFYVDGLGMKIGTRRPGPERIETILVSGGASLLLMSDAHGDHPAIAPGSGFDRLVLRVASLDATVAALKAAGFAVSGEHATMNGMVRVAHAADPDGYRLELVEVRGPVAGGQ